MKWGGFIAVALFLFVAAPARAGLVASSVDEGSLPHAYGGGWISDAKKPPTLSVKAWPSAPIAVSVDVQCWKGKAQRSIDRDLPATTPPFSGPIALTINRPERCYISADASYEDFEIEGRISLTLRSPYAD